MHPSGSATCVGVPTGDVGSRVHCNIRSVGPVYVRIIRVEAWAARRCGGAVCAGQNHRPHQQIGPKCLRSETFLSLGGSSCRRSEVFSVRTCDTWIVCPFRSAERRPSRHSRVFSNLAVKFICQAVVLVGINPTLYSCLVLVTAHTEIRRVNLTFSTEMHFHCTYWKVSLSRPKFLIAVVNCRHCHQD